MKTKLRLIIEVEYETNDTPVKLLKDHLRQVFDAATDDIVNFQDEHTAEALGFVCRIEEGEDINLNALILIEALGSLLDNLTDAGDDKNPETGEVYDSVAYAREALKEAKKLQDFSERE